MNIQNYYIIHKEMYSDSNLKLEHINWFIKQSSEWEIFGEVFEWSKTQSWYENIKEMAGQDDEVFDLINPSKYIDLVAEMIHSTKGEQ